MLHILRQLGLYLLQELQFSLPHLLLLLLPLAGPQDIKFRFLLVLSEIQVVLEGDLADQLSNDRLSPATPELLFMGLGFNVSSIVIVMRFTNKACVPGFPGMGY